MRPFYCFFLFVLFTPLYAQQLEWAAGFQGSGNDNVNDVASDAGGNIYTIGSFGKTTDFDPGPGVYTVSTNSNQNYIVKLDPAGKLLWVKTLQPMLHQVTTDALGNIYISGGFHHVSDLDPGPAVKNFTPVGTDGFVLKLDADGNYIWAAQFKSTSYSAAYAITVDEEQNVIAAGSFNGVTDYDPGPGTYTLALPGPSYYSAVFVTKLDKDGNFIWANMFGNNATSVRSITADKFSNIYFAGDFAFNVDFDPGPDTFMLNTVQFDGYVCKLDKNGEFLWAGQVGGNGSDHISAMAVDRERNIYIGGRGGGAIDADPGPGIYTLNGTGAYVVKLDSMGHFKWARNNGVAGFNLYDMAIDNTGHLYTTGNFAGVVDFDPGPGTYTLQADSNADIFVTRLSPAGKLMWAGHFKNRRSYYQSTWSFISSDPQGNIYLGSAFTGTLDLDPGPPNKIVITGANYVGYIIKLSLHPNLTGVMEDPGQEKMKIYPNPGNGYYIIDCPDLNPSTIVIYNITGKRVDFSMTDHVIDLSAQPQGVYIFQAEFSNEKIFQKIIKN